MKKLFQSALLGLVLLALPGCEPSTGSIRIIHPAIVNRQTSLDNILVNSVSPVGDVETEKQLLTSTVIMGLKETSQFASVGQTNTDLKPGEGVKVTNDIQEIKKVSDNARLWTGALAGQARILVRVTVSDLRSGKEIAVFEVEGKSGKSAKAGTTNEAIQRAAEQVVDQILRINQQTAQLP